jgi:hypothetical protein
LKQFANRLHPDSPLSVRNRRKTAAGIRDLTELIKGGKVMDPLKDFSEAVREERRAYASL